MQGQARWRGAADAIAGSLTRINPAQKNAPGFAKSPDRPQSFLAPQPPQPPQSTLDFALSNCTPDYI